jgi:hypothetical protein
VQKGREGHQVVALEGYILIFDLIIYEIFSNDTVSIKLFKKKGFLKELCGQHPKVDSICIYDSSRKAVQTFLQSGNGFFWQLGKSHAKYSSLIFLFHCRNKRNSP